MGQEFNANMQKVKDELETVTGIICQAKWQEDINQIMVQVNSDQMKRQPVKH